MTSGWLFDLYPLDNKMVFWIKQENGFIFEPEIGIQFDKLRDSILEFFYDKNIAANDTVLFYFSGHGVLGDR